ncbi:DUF2283 domain-containing protein [candidate division WOR-3 bacterium]|nr:DUF2283 domain-containing protein [candidate division WOR-3 bacterium]
MRKRLTNYDEKYDILYISKIKNKPCISSEPIDGVLIRRDERGMIIGITIFDVKKAINILK